MRTIPVDEVIYIADLTPAQAKRLKGMTNAQLKALARKQASRRAGLSKSAGVVTV